MEGYELITSDDKHLGHVVGTAEGNAIVEHGHLRKTRHAVPLAFLHADESERVVRSTLSKQLIEESPKVDDDAGVDEGAVAAYFGLVDRSVADGDGDGELNPGVAAAERERAEIRRHVEAGGTYGSPGRQIIPPDSHE